MRKFLPCGALLAVLAWPGLAPGQTLVEPPPVESFTLGSGQSGGADEDDALNDLFLEASQGAGAANPNVSPSVTGTPPLPPGTPVHTPAAQQTPADNSSFSGTFSPPTDSGQSADFVDPIESPSGAVDPFRPAAGQEPVNSVSSTLSPPPDSGSSFPPAANRQAESASVPLGQGAALPQSGWQSVSGALPPSQYISDAPEPQFDAGSSRWVQPEIGQSFSAGSAQPAGQPRPSSVSTVHTSPSERLDAVLDGDLDTPSPAQAAAPAPSPAASAQTPEGREHLRNLFSDLTSSDSLEAPTAAASAGRTAPPVPDFSGLGAPSPSTSGSQAGPIEEYDGSSAILKAGGLLTLENHYGAAEILPPLTNQPPLKTAAPVVEPPSKQPQAQARPAEPKAAAAPAASGVSKKSKSAKAVGSKRSSSSAKTRAAAPAAKGNLMIINSTGNPRIGDIYQSVLTRMGHTVVSVAQGTPGGATGQTVITYRPGYRAQAQAISRHLPGQKVLTEAKGGQVLASEVMVNIR